MKRYVLVSAAALALGAGAGGAAIAASGGDDEKKAEQSILADAAKRLNVSPDDLRSALSAAEDAQLDQAVKDGKLTQQQADAIKARRKQAGSVLGVPGGPGRGPGFGPAGPGLRLKFGPGGALDAAATALGVKLDDLLTQLSKGKSVADIAKAQGKSLSDVKAAVTDAVTKELDQAVKDGKLTAAQRDDMLKELSDHLDEILNATPPAGGAPGFGLRHGGPGFGGPGFGGPGAGLRFRFGPGGALDAAASALGLKLDDLLTQLSKGKSVAQIAKDQGKDLADVKTAVKDAVGKELDQAVKDGKLTAAQRDDMLKELDDHLDELLNATPPAFHRGALGLKQGHRWQ